MKVQLMLGTDTGRRPATRAAIRGVFAASGIVAMLLLGACTTTEGTNALTDIGTFEREVMSETLRGVGMLDREDKDENIANKRGPLVLPKSNGALPAPAGESSVAALLPQDSGNVQIDTTGLTEDDLRRLRNARVVDLTTMNGRPLTDAEAKKLTARMTADRLQAGPRPLYLPPEEYYTTVKGRDLVCLAKSGELVPLDDAACPPEIRKALAAQAG